MVPIACNVSSKSLELSTSASREFRIQIVCRLHRFNRFSLISYDVNNMLFHFFNFHLIKDDALLRKRTNERKSLNEQWLAPAISTLNIKYEFGIGFVLLLRARWGRLLSPFNCSYCVILPSPSQLAGYVMRQPKHEKKVSEKELVCTRRNEEAKSKSIFVFFFVAQDPRVNALHSNCWLRRLPRHRCYTLTWLNSPLCVHVSCVSVDLTSKRTSKSSGIFRKVQLYGQSVSFVNAESLKSTCHFVQRYLRRNTTIAVTISSPFASTFWYYVDNATGIRNRITARSHFLNYFSCWANRLQKRTSETEQREKDKRNEINMKM